MTAKHSPIGPSAFERAELCPASAVRGQLMPDLAPSFYAAEGTMAHRIMEACLVDPGRQPTEWIGTVTSIEGHDIEVDEDMVFHVGEVLGYLRAATAGHHVEVEVRLELPGTELFGTADVLQAKRRPIVVSDLKYGGGISVSPDAVQLGLYGLMAVLREEGEAYLMSGHPDDVLVQADVMQPRAIGGASFSRHDWTRDDLIKLLARARDLDARVKAGDLTYNAGAHCRFCKIVHLCPRLALIAADPAMSAITSDPTMTISREELDARFKMLPALDVYAKRVSEMALEYLKAGGQLESAKLVEKRALRAWVDEAAAASWLAENGVHPFQEPKVLSPAMAEKILPPSLRHHMKPGELVSKESSGLTVTTSDDKRPSVRLVAAEATAELARMSAQNILTKQKKEA